MASEITSDKILIRDAFNRWYRVPEYQRPYVWGSEEVSDLLDDISDASSTRPNNQYFLGSIVFQTKKKQANYSSYEEDDLLDGQQRLTTCLLLHAVARDLTQNVSLKNSCVASVFQEANPFDGIPERLRIVYDIRPEVRDFVKQFVQPMGGTDAESELLQLAKDSKDRSIRSMAAAIVQIRTYFQSSTGPSLETFFQFFRNQVVLVYVASGTLEDAFRLFTVLNDRGMRLGTSDILKSINLRALYDNHSTEVTVHEVARAWEDMESEFGDDFDLFLGHIRTILLKEKARSGLLQEYEDSVYKTGILKPGMPTLDIMRKYRDHFSAIHSGDNYAIDQNWSFDNLVALLKLSRSDIWLPPMMLYRNTFGTKGLTAFSRKLENKFCADWVLRETPTVRLENMNRIMRRLDATVQDKLMHDDQKIATLLNDKTFGFDVTEVRRRIDTGGVYTQPYSTYLLYKMDMIIGGGDHKLQPPRQISIEHILPQSPKSSSQWCQDFSDDERALWTHRLGNLVLLGRRKNVSLGRLDFKQKQMNYFKGSIQSFPNSIQILKYDSWDPMTLQAHHKKSVDVLMNYFAV